MANIKLLPIGAKVWYRGCWGSDAPVRAIVVDAEMDIKNGRPGYSVDLVDENDKPIADEWERCKWGYADQVTPR